jgi:hypothetical protein
LDAEFDWDYYDTMALQPRPMENPNMGVELTLGRMLAETGYDWDIIKVGIAGSTLAQHWTPTSELLADAEEFVAGAVTELDAAPAAIVMILGTNDAATSMYASAYEDNTYAAIDHWRETYDDVPVVVLRVPLANEYAYKATVRAAQLTSVSYEPYTAMVDGDMTYDGLHWDADSYAILGRRLAMQVAALNGITIPGGTDTGPIHMTSNVYDSYEAFTAQWSGLTSATDWISIGPAGTPLNSYAIWHYSNGTQSPPGSPVTPSSKAYSGVYVGSPTQFVARLHANDTNDLIDESDVFTILP